MGSGIAPSARQVIRAIGKQGDAREIAAEVSEVPRAVDVGRLLQQADGRRTQDQGADQESGGAAQVMQARAQARGGERDERREADQPDEPLAASVDEVECPPGVRADPRSGTGIEEQAIGNPQVGPARGEVEPGEGEENAGYPGVGEPEPSPYGTTARIRLPVHVQKLALV